MVLVKDDVEAVVQIEFSELDLASLGLAPCSGRGCGKAALRNKKEVNRMWEN